MKQVGSKSGPTHKDFNSLQQWLENGYLCGTKVYSNPKFVTKRQIHCGDQIESQYYNKDGIRGGQIITKSICDMYYSSHNIMPVEQIKANQDVGRKNPFPVCWECFNLKITLPTSGGNSNKQEHKRQKKVSKKAQLQKAVSSGRRKQRKTT
eukprot:7759154-Ditylum_brightwellii.AAC.1